MTKDGRVARKRPVAIEPCNERARVRRALHRTSARRVAEQAAETMRDHSGTSQPRRSTSAHRSTHRKFEYPSIGGRCPRLKVRPSPSARCLA
jgi:hypothetical protein